MNSRIGYVATKLAKKLLEEKYIIHQYTCEEHNFISIKINYGLDGTVLIYDRYDSQINFQKFNYAYVLETSELSLCNEELDLDLKAILRAIEFKIKHRKILDKNGLPSDGSPPESFLKYSSKKFILVPEDKRDEILNAPSIPF